MTDIGRVLCIRPRIVRLLRSHLSSPSFLGNVVPEANVSDISSWRVTLSKICQPKQSVALINLIERVDITPGKLRVLLDGARVAELLSIKLDALNENRMVIISAFQLPWRLYRGVAISRRQEILVRVLALGHRCSAELGWP